MRKGFSLIELLIVIMLISIVYYVGLDGVEMTKSKPKALTPLNLKENILSSELFESQATLLCISACKICYLRRGITSAFTEYTSAIDLHDVTAYTIDANDNLSEIEYQRFKDEKICLKMDFYPNGSSTQIILKQDKKSYFLPAFFGTPQAFDSPEEAQDYWLRYSRTLSDNGAFY